MKLRHILGLIFPLFTFSVNAEEPSSSASVFHFSTNVSRIVDKDMMHAEVFSRQAGKNLKELKKIVSTRLNTVLAMTKQTSSIEVNAEGVRHYADYDSKGKVIGWVAEGRIRLKSKDMDALAQILDTLDADVAISEVRFSVSAETLRAMEDEMTLELLQQFKHKAELIQKSLNAESYVLSDIQLDTPNGQVAEYMPRMALASMKVAADELPIEAGKETISATASGKVIFKTK